MEMSQEMQQQLMQFRNFSQQYQMVLAQKQRMSIQQADVERALAEVDKSTGKLFFAAGPVLIESSKEDVKKRLEAQRDEAKTHIDTLSKQEEKVKKRLEEMPEPIETPEEDGTS